jgi:hypothetical protein
MLNTKEFFSQDFDFHNKTIPLDYIQRTKPAPTHPPQVVYVWFFAHTNEHTLKISLNLPFSKIISALLSLS